MSLACRSVLGLLLASLSVISLARPASADVRDFAWSYQWWTPTVNEHELEVHGIYHSDGNEFEPQLEYETGLTPRWGLGLYSLFKVSDTDHFQWNGLKIENRYRLGEYHQDKLLHAGYLELEKEGADPWELEAKWLMSLYGSDHNNYALNLILEHKLSGHAHLEFAYTAGWIHGFRRWKLGLEHTGHTTDREYYLGPTAMLEFGPGSRLVANVMGGLSSDSSPVAAKVIYQHEF